MMWLTIVYKVFLGQLFQVRSIYFYIKLIVAKIYKEIPIVNLFSIHIIKTFFQIKQNLFYRRFENALD